MKFVWTAVGRADLERLRRAVSRSEFARLDEHCCDCPGSTDHPWAYISNADATGLKAIARYDGCPSAPESVTNLEDDILSVVRISRWIGTERQRSRHDWGNDPE
jgi:hypothetical protein